MSRDGDGEFRREPDGTGVGCPGEADEEVGRVDALLGAVRSALMIRPWVAAPRQVRLPPETLRTTTAGRMACSPRQLVAPTSGCWRKVKRASRSAVRCFDQSAVGIVGVGGFGEQLDPLSEVGDDGLALALGQVPGIEGSKEDVLHLTGCARRPVRQVRFHLDAPAEAMQVWWEACSSFR